MGLSLKKRTSERANKPSVDLFVICYEKSALTDHRLGRVFRSLFFWVLRFFDFYRVFRASCNSMEGIERWCRCLFKDDWRDDKADHVYQNILQLSTAGKDVMLLQPSFVLGIALQVTWTFHLDVAVPVISYWPVTGRLVDWFSESPFSSHSLVVSSPWAVTDKSFGAMIALCYVTALLRFKCYTILWL